MKSARAAPSIYLDYAATTPMDPRVLKAMLPYLSDKFGNAASLHRLGREARKALEQAREGLARALGAKPREIVFTGSATESNNTALKGAAFASPKERRHVVVSAVEHACVLNSARWLQGQGFDLTIVPVDARGRVDAERILHSVRPDTLLVSVMHANNELGTIEPVARIGAALSAGTFPAARERSRHKVLFHTDAAQTFGKLPFTVDELQADLLTASSHKIYGPKGAALLYVREGVPIDPLLHGGGHEGGRRSSTVNLPAVVGFAKAVSLALAEQPRESERLASLSQGLLAALQDRIPELSLNGDPDHRLPNILNLRFPGIEAESLLFQLDQNGILTSTEAGCGSMKWEPSPVLLACGLSKRDALGSLRLSLGRWTKRADLDYLVKTLPPLVQKLRRLER